MSRYAHKRRSCPVGLTVKLGKRVGMSLPTSPVEHSDVVSIAKKIDRVVAGGRRMGTALDTSAGSSAVTPADT